MNKDIRNKLRSDFPSIYVKDIDTALKIHKMSYPATYYYLEQQVTSKQIQIKSKHCNKTYINNDAFIEVNPTIECNCCCDNKPIAEFGQCTDGHLMCKVCIKKHADNTIFQQLSCKIKCIDCTEKCNGTYTEDLLKSLLNDRVFAEYINLKNIDEANELCIDDINIKLCQHCGAGTDIGEYSDQTLLVCMECFKDTCLLCNQVDHPGKQCYSLGNISQSKRHIIEDKMSEALIVKCKKCNKSIFKDEGCNKIKCVCGAYSCFICKSIIPLAIGYSHFCKKPNCNCDKCHLYNENKVKRILDAVKDDYNEDTKKLIKRLL